MGSVLTAIRRIFGERQQMTPDVLAEREEVQHLLQDQEQRIKRAARARGIDVQIEAISPPRGHR